MTGSKGNENTMNAVICGKTTPSCPLWAIENDNPDHKACGNTLQLLHFRLTDAILHGNLL